MSVLARKKCVNHPDRESVALCPGCNRHFCRECISPYQTKVLCQSCIDRLRPQKKKSRGWLSFILASLQIGFSLLLLLIIFYHLAIAVASAPHDFHDGSVWEVFDVTQP